MSQVHSVTHVPVHSPLSEACLPYSCALAHRTYGVGVAGGNGPLRFSLACLGFSFLFRGVQRGYFSFQARRDHEETSHRLQSMARTSEKPNQVAYYGSMSALAISRKSRTLRLRSK